MSKDFDSISGLLNIQREDNNAIFGHLRLRIERLEKDLELLLGHLKVGFVDHPPKRVLEPTITASDLR